MPLLSEVMLKDNTISGSNYKPIDDIIEDDLTFPVDVAVTDEGITVVVASLCQNVKEIYVTLDTQNILTVKWSEDTSCPQCPGCKYKFMMADGSYVLNHNDINAYDYNFSFKLAFKYYHDRISAYLDTGMLVVNVPAVGPATTRIPVSRVPTKLPDYKK